jgi:P-type E1-E2 ATPase
LIENQGLSLIASLQAGRDRLEADGSTVVYLSVADRVRAIFGLTETIRPDVEQVLAAVRAENRIIEILTGDSQTAGDALGRRLGVTVHSQLLPHDKLRLIELAERTGSVAMIGDGLNDAPALARAGIGIALGCGADVTREAADVSLLGDDLTQIAWLLALARRTYRTIGWNLAWAFIYNVIGIGLALAGILHPILAAIAMVVSSAMVIGNSLRLFKTKLIL